MSWHAQLPHCAQKTPEIRLSLRQENRKLDVVVHACNSGTREKEAGGLLGAHGQSSLGACEKTRVLRPQFLQNTELFLECVFVLLPQV